MSKTKVFIDGAEGTTGLTIRKRLEKLAENSHIEILQISEALRKDRDERKKYLNAADFVFLCLPDDASKEAVSLIENDSTRVIDASTAHRIENDAPTAHRIEKGWTYGFPELSPERREKIRVSKRVAIPGCYASGFLALARPLTHRGIIPGDYPVTCYAISGYSGGGKKAIAEYQNEKRNAELDGARLYALTQEHKHLREMMHHSGLKFGNMPMFNPIIDDFYSGMIVNIPVITRTLPEKYQKDTAQTILNAYKEHYNQQHSRIRVVEDYNEPFLAANALSGSDEMELFVFGKNEHVLLTARLDNLGKGAGGAAVQCFELMKGNS